MLLVFSITLFIGSALTFLIQPMAAKMLLPMFGGAPAVWITCVLFFQSGLLCGYAYAHFAPIVLGRRRQTYLHLLLLLVSLLVLPVSISSSWAPPIDFPPSLWLLWLLLLNCGLPFVMVSATAPLLQKWFASTFHYLAGDPYFLYVSSNLGSMLALLSYPILLEPALNLRQQSWLWTGAYAGLIGSASLCAYLGRRSKVAVQLQARTKTKIADGTKSAETDPETQTHGIKSVTIRLRLRWLALAFVPSSLMLSVTTYLTTDLVAMPLLWVTPLVLYLLTFILTFARKPVVRHSLISRYLPLVILILTIVLLSEATEPVWLLMLLHLAGLFFVSLFCHGNLARLRPGIQYLTEFYFWLSLGGVLGGLFNALIAPLLFTSVAEYPVALILACLLRQPRKADTHATRKTKGRTIFLKDVLPAAILGIATLTLIFAASGLFITGDVESHRLMMAVTFGIPAVVCYTFLERPLRFGLGITALYLASWFTPGIYGHRIYAERTFFGIHRVTEDRQNHFRKLVHGSTVHGQQSTLRSEKSEPLTYYHRTGPIGLVFQALDQADAPLNQIAVVGLGVGSLAAYGRPDQELTFYELDPVVVRIAKNPEYFTYLRDSEAKLSFVLGDARLMLAKHGDRKYDLIVLDAFTSDAVPLHLLTKEALQIYLSRLKTNGVIAFHISNRYLDLEPVLSALAHDAGLTALANSDRVKETVEAQRGKFASDWVVMSRSKTRLEAILRSGNWRRLKNADDRFLWTDQFSNIFTVFKWQD